MKILKNIFTILFLSNIVFARPIIKLATVAQKAEYNLLFEMGQRWQQETAGQVQLRIYKWCCWQRTYQKRSRTDPSFGNVINRAC